MCNTDLIVQTQQTNSGKTYPHNENPLDEGKAEATDGPIAPCNGVGQTERQAEPDPVKQEGH